jgi:hypothetical protein
MVGSREILRRTIFQPGDKVRHSAKPQWGLGRVERADRVSHDGQEAQKLVVTFPNHGRVTLHTGFAPLTLANAPNPPSTQPMAETALPIPALLETLKTLPEPATDPLRSLAGRLGATLDLYRFTTEPRSLLDWAVAQTGLEDPLSHLNRHELEQAFGAFAVRRDKHLRDLLRSLRKEGQGAVIDQAGRHANPAARTAVSQALRSL